MTDNNASKALTEKDGSKASVKQPDILDQNRDACEDKNDFELDTMNDDCWNDDVIDIKTNLIDENQKKEYMDNKEVENHTIDEHVNEPTNDSIESKDTDKSKNDKKINHERKTDMI